MLSFLKNHPFAVEAYFESSMVFTFAFPKETLQNLIPECLQLDTFENHWAFVAVAMVQTKHLRPKGFPQFLGNDFFLIGYRIFVRYTNLEGKNLRGLYILKSETNKSKMEFLGNIFTQYQYSTTDIEISQNNDINSIKSMSSKFSIDFLESKNEVKLPPNSPFSDWKNARKFAGPLPFTFTYNSQNNTVLIIEGVRQNWTPKPIQVIDYQFSFFEERNLPNPILANAFIIEKIPYYWKKGKIETLNR